MSEEPTIEYLVNLSNKLSAEVERLQEENAHFAWRDKDKNKLIAALADALSDSDSHWLHKDLLQRAWDATKEGDQR